jgi:hypothetical protein
MSHRLVLLMLAGAIVASALMAARLWMTDALGGTDALIDIALFALPGALAGATFHLLLKPKR